MTKSWRDLLPVHPAADLFPMMSPDELKALGEDIKANGMKMPITVLIGENQGLLDGRNRVAALEMAGLDFQALYEAARDGKPRQELHIRFVGDPGSINVLTGEVADPWSYVVSTNIHRRHLTTVQKTEIVAALLKAKPERSDRATAKIAKVDHKTVAAKREKLEAGGEIPHQEKRVGSDGKSQPKAKGQVPLDDPARPRNRDVAKPAAPATVARPPKYQVLYLIDSVKRLPPDQRRMFFNLCSQQEKWADQMRAALARDTASTASIAP